MQQKIRELYRRHIRAQKRDPHREVPIAEEGSSTCRGLAAYVVDVCSSPSHNAARREKIRFLEESLERMEPMDRNILTLLFYKRLSTAEAARVLRISEAAARQRYGRAKRKLKALLRGLTHEGSDYWLSNS